MFYSGLTRRKSALIQVAYSLITLAIISIQWFLWGYSLVFSEQGGWFIGNLKYFGYNHVAGKVNDVNFVTELANSLFDGMFCIVTGSLLVGCVAERGRVLPTAVFLFVWATLVYDPIAYWTWNPRGWASRLGILDYAGGTPVHITSGFSALAYSYALGKRDGHGTAAVNYRPHNTLILVIGTACLWAGWVGFNCGSAGHPGLQSAMALINTQLSASMGGLTWAYMDHRLDGKWSIVGFCSGIVAGLVSITPGAGFVRPWTALLFGAFGGLFCNLATKVKFYLRVDDALDVLAIHGAGGFIGTLLTGIFAVQGSKEGHPGGWLAGNFSCLVYQIIGSVSGALYSFLMTIVILTIMQRIPGLHIRVSRDEEAVGLDLSEHDELAYAWADESGLDRPDGATRGESHIQGLFSSIDDVNGVIDEYDFTTTDDDDSGNHAKTIRPVPSTENASGEEFSTLPLLDRD